MPEILTGAVEMRTAQTAEKMHIDTFSRIGGINKSADSKKSFICFDLLCPFRLYDSIIKTKQKYVNAVFIRFKNAELQISGFILSPVLTAERIGLRCLFAKFIQPSSHIQMKRFILLSLVLFCRMQLLEAQPDSVARIVLPRDSSLFSGQYIPIDQGETRPDPGLFPIIFQNGYGMIILLNDSSLNYMTGKYIIPRSHNRNDVIRWEENQFAGVHYRIHIKASCSISVDSLVIYFPDSTIARYKFEGRNIILTDSGASQMAVLKAGKKITWSSWPVHAKRIWSNEKDRVICVNDSVCLVQIKRVSLKKMEKKAPSPGHKKKTRSGKNIFMYETAAEGKYTIRGDTLTVTFIRCVSDPSQDVCNKYLVVKNKWNLVFLPSASSSPYRHSRSAFKWLRL